MKQLLVAVDFSKSTDAVLEQASILAKELEAKLWVLHVASNETQALAFDSSQFSGFAPEFVSMPGDVQLARNLSAEEIKREHAQLQGISSSIRANGVNAQAVLLKGDAAATIVEKATHLDADMIILGSHGHGLLHKALLGSVSEAVLRRANCNVLVVPVPEG
jgi:nucleotide-binding universal stress UspA family protein